MLTDSTCPRDFPTTDIPTFLVDQARHAVSFPAGASVVDTVGAVAYMGSELGCSVLGFDSRGTSVPIWSWNLTGCNSYLLYDDDRYIDVSDDGTTAAFSATVPAGNSTSPLLVVFDAQTGAVRYQKTFPAGSGAGPVHVTANGKWVGWVGGPGLNIYDGTTGALRTTVTGVGSNAKVSDDGSVVTDCTVEAAAIYAWTGTKYAVNVTLMPPGSGQWFCTDSALSSDASIGNLVSFAWIDDGSLTARVTVYDIATDKFVVDWKSSTNTKLQTNPTVRADGIYTGVALWGDADDVPTAVVLAAGSSTPLFTYTTPGSMFGVDILLDAGSSTPTKDAVFFAVSGKAVPANEFGNGGDVSFFLRWKHMLGGRFVTRLFLAGICMAP